MSNLFVVNTPLQLLTAYIVANTHFPETDNCLIMFNPRLKHLVESSMYTRVMLEDRSTWGDRTILLDRWLRSDTKLSILRQEVRNLQEQIFKLSPTFRRVLIGSDKTLQNQLMVEISGNQHYYRLEDGVWSYAGPDRRMMSKFWQSIRIKALRRAAGLDSDMVYNTGGLGYGPAALGDYLYKPHLLERYSPSVIEIKRSAVLAVMDRLLRPDDGFGDITAKEVVLFLGGLHVERNEVSIDDEMTIVAEISGVAAKGGFRLLYKPHPAEGTEKLKTYCERITNLELLDRRDPVEVIYSRLHGLRAVLAHSSSGLLFADTFSHRAITTVALFGLYGAQKNDPVLQRLMHKAGVTAPKDVAQLRQTLRRLE